MLDTARRLLVPSARSDVPPFMVMDVMAAAARIEAAGGHVIYMEVGPARRARAAHRDCSREGRARQGGHRLHPGARHPGAACADFAPLCGGARRDGRTGTHRGDDGLLGRLHPGVSFAVRAGRSRRGRVSRLSALPSHPHRAWLRAGADSDFGGDALVDHDRCACSRRTGARRSRACWSQARPIRPAR